jgi:hypothetical protein
VPVCVHIPTRLRAVPGSLVEPNVAAIGDALTAAAQRALARSRAEVQAKLGEGVQVRLNDPVLRWSGDLSGQVGPGARTLIERAIIAALAHAVARALLPTEPAAPRNDGAGEPVRERFDPARYDARLRAYVVPSYKPPTGGRQKVPLSGEQKQGRPWHLRLSASFHLTPAHFFDIYEGVLTATAADEGDLRGLHAEVLETHREATAWVVEVLQETGLQALADNVHTAFHASRSAGEKVYGVFGWGSLRKDFVAVDEDHTLAGKVPEFGNSGYLVDKPPPGGGPDQRTMLPGGWLLLVFLPLPRVVLEDVVRLGDSPNIKLVLRDTAGLVDEDDFAAAVKVIWAEAEQYAGDSQADVLAQKFTIRRRVPDRTLAVLMRQQRETLSTGSGRLGRAMALDDAALAPLRPALRAFLETLREDKPPAPKAPDADGFWPAGARGANVLAAYVDDLEMRVLGGKNATFLRQQVDEVGRIFTLKDSFWGNDRTEAMQHFVDRWEKRDARLFELLLDELGRRGQFQAFIDEVRTLSGLFDTIRRRIILALLARTRYANDARIAALTRTVELAAAGTLKFHYDDKANEIWIDGKEDKKLRAAGMANADAKAGVVAEIEPYYSDSARVYQFSPELLDKLREPTRKKVGELMARMICGSGETMTQEQLLQKAMQEAAAELKPPPTEKDLVKVTLQQSVKVLKVERKVELGVTETNVTYQEVRRLGSEPWETVGEPKEVGAYAFESRLKVFHVEHLIDFLGTLVLAESVVIGAFLVIEVAAVSLGTLLAFVAIRLVIYRFTTDQADRTLDGYLIAALQGELDAVGFKLVSGVAKGVAQSFAGRLLARELISEVSTKWIVFGLRGLVTATGVGATEVVNQFAEDLLTLSNCKGWSGVERYWDRFKTGFCMALLMEFVAIPLLAPPLRLALEKAGTAVDAAVALRKTGRPLGEIAGLLLKGTEALEEALGRTIKQPGAAPALVRGFRERIQQVLKSLASEYQSRAYASLLDLYGPELSSEAVRGLRRLIGAAGEREVDALMQRLLAQKVAPTDLLRVLGSLDEEAIGALAKAGQMERLAASPRIMALAMRNPAGASKLLTEGPFKLSVDRLEAYIGRLETLSPAARDSVLEAIAAGHPFPPDLLLAAARQKGALDTTALGALTRLADSLAGRAGQLERLAASPRLLGFGLRNPDTAAKLLEAGPFKGSVDRLEAYLGQLEKLPPGAGDSVLNAIASGHPLPPELLLAAARQVGALDAPTLDLLKRLAGAKIVVGKLFDGSGPQLAEFAEKFGKLSAAEQRFALQLAEATTPQRVLTQASEARGELRSVARELDPARARRGAALDPAVRARGRELVLSRLRTGKYQIAILDTVLAEHAKQLAILRKALSDFAPDAIFGSERGGQLLAESAAAGDPKLASRVVAITTRTADAKKLPVATVMQDFRAKIAALYDGPGRARRFVFTETFLSGTAVQTLEDHLLIPIARQYKDAEFLGLWMREGLGFDVAVGSPAGIEAVPVIKGVPNLKAGAVDVPFIVAEDAKRVIEGAGTEPLYVFGSDGRIVEVLEPKPGETTRSMIIRILLERGGP